MYRRLTLAAAVCLMLVAVNRGDDTRDDAKLIQGTWVPAAAELGGEKLANDHLKAMKLTLQDDKYTATVGSVKDVGTCKLDPAKKPKAMDIVGTEGPNKGKTILAIYELTDDTLKICYAFDGKTRPAEFKATAENKFFLVSWKRQKQK